MLSVRFLSLVLVLMTAFSAAAAPQSKRPGAGARRAPWLVTVRHEIDIAQYIQSRQNTVPGVEIGRPAADVKRIVNIASGVIIDENGRIITRLVNLDPSAPSHELSVTTSDGRTAPARFVGFDGPTGLALIEAPTLRSIPPAPVVAVPTYVPAGTITLSRPEYRVSAGAVPFAAVMRPFTAKVTVAKPPSAFARGGVACVIESGTFTSSSDLSLVESPDGRVVGIAKYISPGRGHVIGLTFIRETVVRRIAERKGNVDSGWLGIQGTAAANGVVLDRIEPRGPAEVAGMQPGDRVVKFDDFAITNNADLAYALLFTPAETAVSIQVMREGKPTLLRPVLKPKPAEPSLFGPPSDPVSEAKLLASQADQLRRQLDNHNLDPKQRAEIELLLDSIEGSLEKLPPTPDTALPPVGTAEPGHSDSTLGLSVVGLTDQLSDFFGVKGGLLVTSVDPNSVASRAGLRAGDVVVRVGQVDAVSEEIFEQTVETTLASGSARVVLHVRRDQENLTITLSLR